MQRPDDQAHNRPNSRPKNRPENRPETRAETWAKRIFQLWLAVACVAAGVWIQTLLRDHHMLPFLQGDPSTAITADTTAEMTSGVANAQETEEVDHPTQAQILPPKKSNRPFYKLGKPLTAGDEALLLVTQSSIGNDEAQAARVPLAARAEIQRCISDGPSDKLTNLDKFRSLYLAEDLTRELLWQKRNFHLANGEERRLRLYLKERQADPDATPHYRIQIFQVNEDGLPERVAIPEDQASNPKSALVQQMIAGAEEFYESHEERYRGPDQLVVNVRYENNHVIAIEYSSDDGFLRCLAEPNGESTCQCHHTLMIN